MLGPGFFIIYKYTNPSYTDIMNHLDASQN